ncbi:MAG: hypothetical protein DCC75_07265 [Proteobacteria bacterium]|nr:MAG: hypothetical protein DCC75_07265 [Pseudomonadota bacterium]
MSFIPFRYKEETFAERSAEIKKQARFMVGRYSDAQLPLWQTAAIIVVQGGLLCANAIWKVLDDWLAINISVILTAELGATQGKRKLMLPMGLRVDDGLQ